MTQTDLPLFGCLRRNQFVEAVRQAEEMERLVRPHPCNIMVTYINEPFPERMDGTAAEPDPDGDGRFFECADAVPCAWPIPTGSSRRSTATTIRRGPGLPDNHCYTGWYNGHGIDLGKLHKGYWQRVKPGWVYGCGEFGAEGLDPVGVMRKHYPQAWLPADGRRGEDLVARQDPGADRPDALQLL